MLRRLRRAGMCMLALAVPALAQFADLATTDDGSQLYFTSTMQLKDADRSAPTARRLYRYALSRVSLYADRSVGGLSRVSLSGDGSVIGYTVQQDCVEHGCWSAADHAEVRGRSTLDVGPGAVQISRNGRWALVYLERTNCTGMMCSTEDSATLVDLLDGRRVTTPVTADRSSWMRSLTSDGGVLGVQPGNSIGIGGVALPVVGVWKDGRFTPVPLPAGRAFFAEAISDDGRAVIVSESDPSRPAWSLLGVSTATGAMLTIASPTDSGAPSLLSVSNDGRRVLYAMLGGSNGRAYVWDAATGLSMPVPLHPDESPTDGVLTGDGRVAFVATTRARIVRYTIDVDVAAAIFPPPPYCDDPGQVALGSLTRLHCSLTGSVDALQGKILHGSIAVPVVSASTGEIDIQIPWEGEHESRLSYDVPTDSPFRGSQSVYAEQGAPEILPDPHGLFGMRAARGDWSGPLTSLPGAGEIFHVYMTGLGPVQGEQTTGVPAPHDQAVPIYWRLDCSLPPGGQPVETLFAGLAPGLLGVYQTTFRMPAIPARGAQPDGFNCVLASDTTVVGFSPGSPRWPICGSGCGIVTGPVPTRDPPR